MISDSVFKVITEIIVLPTSHKILNTISEECKDILCRYYLFLKNSTGHFVHLPFNLVLLDRVVKYCSKGAMKGIKDRLEGLDRERRMTELNFSRF